MGFFILVSQGWRETCFDTWRAALETVEDWVREDEDHPVTVCIMGTKAQQEGLKGQ